MKRRIAIPMEGNVLCDHFGHCEAFVFVDVENDKIVNTSRIDAPDHQHGSFPRFIMAHGATDLLCGGIGQHAVSTLSGSGINVVCGTPVDTVEKLIHDYLSGNLKNDKNQCDHSHHSHQNEHQYEHEHQHEHQHEHEHRHAHRHLHAIRGKPDKP